MENGKGMNTPAEVWPLKIRFRGRQESGDADFVVQEEGCGEGAAPLPQRTVCKKNTLQAPLLL